MKLWWQPFSLTWGASHMAKIIIVALAAMVTLAVAAWLLFSSNGKGEPLAGSVDPARVATVYKSPLCGCCVSYISYLRDAGYQVEVVESLNTGPVKDRFGIAREMESCHTSVFGHYFVEGHVPFEVVDKLLAEQPDIRGIALPDMPAGSPGMPGTKKEPWAIYALEKDGSTSLYMNY